MAVLAVHGCHGGGSGVAFVVGVMCENRRDLGDTSPQGYLVELGEAAHQVAFDLAEDRRNKRHWLVVCRIHSR